MCKARKIKIKVIDNEVPKYIGITLQCTQVDNRWEARVWRKSWHLLDSWRNNHQNKYLPLGCPLGQDRDNRGVAPLQRSLEQESQQTQVYLRRNPYQQVCERHCTYLSYHLLPGLWKTQCLSYLLLSLINRLVKNTVCFLFLSDLIIYQQVRERLRAYLILSHHLPTGLWKTRCLSYLITYQQVCERHNASTSKLYYPQVVSGAFNILYVRIVNLVPRGCVQNMLTFWCKISA